MPTPSLTLGLVPGRYAVCRLDASEQTPAWSHAGPFSSVTRTEDELSVICSEAVVPGDVRAERGWAVLRVAGPLDFGLTGVAAALTVPLAGAGISVLLMATHDTDYLLVREASLAEALAALAAAGHAVPSLH